MDEVIQQLRIFRKRLEQQHKGVLDYGDGNPLANVAVVAYEPDADERVTQRGRVSGVVRDMIEGMGVPATGCWFTYVLKKHYGGLLHWPQVSPWSENFWEELSIIKPKATILLGVETAWAVLGTSESDVEELRKKRFVHERAPFTNFFVTYCSADAARYPVGSKFRGMLAQDLESVFMVHKGYFTPVSLK